MNDAPARPTPCPRFPACDWIDTVCDRLESAWNTGSPPRLEDFLDLCPRPAGSRPCRELVLELAMIDLERRWRASGANRPARRKGRTGGQPGRPDPLPDIRPPLLEDYLRRFPELGSPDQLPEEAIAFEYRTRCACGQPPGISEYVHRFPVQADRLRRILLSAAGGQPDDRGTASWLPEPPSAQFVPPCNLGRYRLLERVGKGGMGEVYKAVQPGSQSLVAVKVLAKGLLQDGHAQKRFRREMQTAGRVLHPNVVRALEAGDVHGTHFLVTEYVDGWSLEELVRLCHPLGFAEASELVRQAALGLRCVHEHGLVHRDIKPSNLMLARQGLVKILDLGLSLFAGEASSQQGGTMTASGELLGTFEYVAPEQISNSHNVDRRADIYSLGCTLYKLLAGQPPFPRAQYRHPLEMVMAHRSQPPPPIGRLRRGVPDLLAAVLERMLAKDPEDRFRSAADVAQALLPFADRRGMPGLAARAAKGASSRQ